MPAYISGAAFFITPFDTVIVREDLLSQDEARQLSALHHILAFMTAGKDMSRLFNEVAPLTSSANVQIKRLSYLYVMQNSQQHVEKAILQAGTFVKDTLHDSPFVRGAALRTMTSLEMSVMVDFVNAPLRRGVKDDCSYVRHAAVIGILK
uniref:AP-1 complex subunit beta n=1 Tax=Lygus hesperus TaxID=30085 RepID=A0A0A9XDH2_LYGHE